MLQWSLGKYAKRLTHNMRLRCVEISGKDVLSDYGKKYDSNDELRNGLCNSFELRFMQWERKEFLVFGKKSSQRLKISNSQQS